MEAIKELINIGLSPRVDRIETFQPYHENHKSKSYKLYKGLKNNSFHTEEEARKALYGENKEGFKFNMLKKRLKERLYNTILFLKPLTRSSDHITKNYEESVYFCHKHYVIAKLLLFIHAFKSGFPLLNKVLKTAQEYEQHDIALLCSLRIRLYSLRKGEQKEFNTYNKLYLQTLNIIQAEAEGEELLQSILFHFSKKISFDQNFIENVDVSAKKLRLLKEKYNTYQLNFQHFYLSLISSQVKADYEEAMSLCNIYESYLEQNTKFFSRIRYANFLLLKMNTALYARDHEKGKECFENALPLFPVGNTNWFLLYELYFSLLLKNKKYDEAGEIMNNIFANKRLADMPQHNHEIWIIYSAYLWFILTYKGLTELRNQTFSKNKDFNLKTFLNNFPNFNQDKQGYNIPILILHILILMLNKKSMELTKRAEVLKKYLQKHLKLDETYRNQIFIRMLIRAIEIKFDYQLMNDTRSKTLLKKLNKQEVTLTPTQYRIELIPYEKLWNIVLEIAKKKK